MASPWKLVDQRLDTDKTPHELHLEVKAERGSRYPCPECGQPCAAHDFQEKRWRHLNFFQHHCYIHASVPRVKCPEHGVKLVEVPWARKGSAFTLLFEQAALTLAREMPVNAAARIIEITDKRLWRIVEHYVDKAIAQFDLSDVRAIGLDETASKRGHNYVTVFIDMQKRQEPVLFVTPGKGKATLGQFSAFLKARRGDPAQIREAVCDMSLAFLGGLAETLPTVDWFHIVQTFTRAVDEVRKQEARVMPLPRHLRWSVLKRGEPDRLTTNQLKALAELLEQGLDTATAWRIKEGTVALDSVGEDTPNRPMAYSPVHRLCTGTGRRQPLAGTDSQGIGDAGKACKTCGAPMDVDLHQRPHGRAEQPVPGGSGKSQGISEQPDPHDHDLHDRQPGRFYPQIHMKRRRAL